MAKAKELLFTPFTVTLYLSASILSMNSTSVFPD